MTVSSETARVQYDGNDVTVEFAIPFYFFADGDIAVYLDDTLKTLTTHYTVADAGEPSGGTLTMLTAPATGETLTIIRDVALTQETDYVENSSFPADSHENAIDRLTMISQQLQEEINRAITASPDSEETITVPTPEAGKALLWNAGGTDLENSTDDFDDIVTDAETAQTAAEAAQTAAETAQTNAETAETNAETAQAAAEAAAAQSLSTDVAHEFTAMQNYDATALSIAASAVDWNFTNVPYGKISVTENFTLNAPTGLKDGAIAVLRCENTGAYDITFNVAYDWGDQDTPSLVSGADKDTVFVFTSDGTRVYGVASWSDAA